MKTGLNGVLLPTLFRGLKILFSSVGNYDDNAGSTASFNLVIGPGLFAGWYGLFPPKAR